MLTLVAAVLVCAAAAGVWLFLTKRDRGARPKLDDLIATASKARDAAPTGPSRDDVPTPGALATSASLEAVAYWTQWGAASALAESKHLLVESLILLGADRPDANATLREDLVRERAELDAARRAAVEWKRKYESELARLAASGTPHSSDGPLPPLEPIAPDEMSYVPTGAENWHGAYHRAVDELRSIIVLRRELEDSTLDEAKRSSKEAALRQAESAYRRFVSDATRHRAKYLEDLRK